MYAVKGAGATFYRDLKEFEFTIAMEDGRMSRAYLVRFDLTTVPYAFIVGNNCMIEWYGSVDDEAFRVRRSSFRFRDNTLCSGPCWR